ncbi:transcription termination factor Rho [Leptotrichia shahii]|uniref:Transcription termination factor Rho n=2 Tax=Leptotrichia shahii TaxID=157691 RepID=A0A510JQW3_9FUSO|nr:transcription termination factor Rho [Leptotrichia shahii]BBM40053.1 transcription termination factor Rho [Leptotrichia shahii]
MIKKEKKIEDEKVLEEQPETTKLRRGRIRNIETDKILESAESGEEKKHKDDENLNYEEKMIKDILSENVTKLKKMAKEYKIEGFSGMSKLELINAILIKKGEERGKTYGFGKLDVIGDGNYGFLRNTSIGPDVYVSISQIKRFFLRNEDIVFGELRIPIGTEKNYGILKVLLVNGDLPEKSLERPYFDDLVPSYPDEKLNLGGGEISSRIIDLVSPIGKGQRGLIVAPPKAGKTVLLSTLANDIIKYNPEIDVWILLIDERPEEVTDIKENVKDAEVYSATFDEDPRVHTEVTENVLQMAKRQVERGKDILILMDSLTRLARSYNITIPSSGKLISGGIDPNALYYPKRFLGAARNIKNGGSLTIIATALVETGSRMDEVIFEEFKGTGNMEIILSRTLEQLRIFPAIDVLKSGTRREELLIPRQNLEKIWKLRRELNEMSEVEGIRNLIELIKKYKNNDELLEDLYKTKKINK